MLTCKDVCYCFQNKLLELMLSVGFVIYKPPVLFCRNNSSKKKNNNSLKKKERKKGNCTCMLYSAFFWMLIFLYSSLLSLFHIMYLFRQSISVIQSCYTYIYIYTHTHHQPSSGIPEFRFQCVNVIQFVASCFSSGILFYHYMVLQSILISNH